VTGEGDGMEEQGMDEQADVVEDQREDEREDEAVEADERLLAIVESVMFAAGEPLTMARLADAVPGPSRAELRAALRMLGERAEGEGRGIRLVEVAGGYQFRTAPEYAQWVRRLFQQKPWRLTRATLETLAIVGYKQPITRAEIEAIRGVDVDSVLASLLSRKLIRIVGRKEVVGRPLIYGTTRQFLEVFGLRDLASLPSLSEVVQPMPDGVGAGTADTGGEASAADSEDEASAADSGDETEEERESDTGGDEGDSTAADAGPGGAVLAEGGGGTDPAGTSDGERSDGHDPGDTSPPD